ncbi:hypothetical protein [Streptomyces capitiformicae]|uniref:Uncharacterized protein n=1 Tax=Streptomyces capitiformicae TaxID=2014920 RepID=A0A919L2Z9_9ACTN|nr:hypothetical protein [Streptomyces capitiformicae]GHH80831.1 hypothetical protein GCM10017771_01140 [Streptomyces capitiformicae]
MINDKDADGTGFLPGMPRPAILTVVTYCRYLKGFTQWLTGRGITRFVQVTAADLDEGPRVLRCPEEVPSGTNVPLRFNHGATERSTKVKRTPRR